MSITAERRLASLAAAQWGMLTAAQANAAGIARSTLVRRVQAGTLLRVRPGVYRLPGTPAERLEDIRAAWLASDPATLARDRLATPDVVVGGAAAAWSHEIGDLYPAPYLLYTSKRRQSTHDDVRYSRRSLPASDVTILDGLPVTTRERTIADLLNEGDLSLVADALRDAERADNDLDVPALIDHLGAHAKRLGYDDGRELYVALRSLAGVDAARLRDIVESTDLTERISAVFGEQLQTLLAPVYGRMGAEIAEMLRPTREYMDKRMRQMPALQPPLVTLPDSVLPKIGLTPATQAMLRDLAERSAKLTENSLPNIGLTPATQAMLRDLAERSAKLTENSLPNIGLTPATQAMLRDLAERSAKLTEQIQGPVEALPAATDDLADTTHDEDKGNE
ncbi:type IV toxin-antitoxin system AbiEi family antitoxin domain-containing protein (plasmid) [Curtobacterium flaccumfaciens pv. flaccumfaciens]|uniref:type IV toxin-antitoxin system AbiEi family antitoxin domain-containing protein n=1 Tax=Curtobacterium TaxID=2034 RepID=UPI00217EC8C0|nr:type IV toxin-antitoxin system AbiEi family antitoxin domain-containing protein [Curtobacterium flaccumfaciens]MCS6567078.1 type IV toxin-antitoxin system AbiEi family antitoxin domain-containing protein [Curtobacterium flaccumfaciens pv. flaccumfaciens]